jgi:hypothetical protein
MTHDPRNADPSARHAAQSLTVAQSARGYWSVQRGGTELAFAMTRQAAEREREMLDRLGRCRTRRAGGRSAAVRA